MASEKFIIYDNKIIDNVSPVIVTGNGTFDLAISPTENNPNNYNSLRVVIEYIDGTPASSTRKYDIIAIVESNNGEPNPAWFPVAYQFDPFRRDFKGKTRVILLQSDIVNVDVGLDDGVFVGGQTIARISRQQGKLGAEFRVRLVITEKDFGGPGAFQDVTLSVYGERFNV